MATTKIRKADTVAPFYEYLEAYFERPDAKGKSVLASDAGISRMYLHDLLKREKNVSLEIAIRLADAMGTTLEKILKNAHATVDV